ncbi:hypothetical protein [Sphingomonas sp. S2-65]|uniref:hypothetical protein n=1 Tax=Sphingomonas sp. S2-65 TaxID=2903960 RepID=UPI001F45656E|nr:hypothetical protein [Sphingomonas sp. S2-65]UYY57041.1 hypothetical protein LZ586_10115 [Sphingomonas sp. S2-65]
MTGQSETLAPRKPVVTVMRLLLAWLAVVAAFFAWQTAEYQGLVARFAEWQFSRFGGFYPLASLLLLVFLFGAPVLYTLSARAHRQNGNIGTPFSQARALFRFLAWVALTMGLAASVALLLAVTASMGSGAPVTLDLASARGVIPDNGPATLKGTVLLDRVATMGADTPLGGWEVRFVPVVGGRGGPIRFFVQTREPLGKATAASVTGSLQRNGLRGDLIPLFTNAGYRVSTPHYVLYTDARAMRVPYLWTALQYGLVALVFGLAAWFQHRRSRRLHPRTPNAARPAL